MNLSAEYLNGLAADTGFRPETLEKVIRPGELAADVGRHPLLSRVVALKGGTALNLFFGSPVRLFGDLDFNYIGHEDRARTQADQPEVERAVIASLSLGQIAGDSRALCATIDAGSKFRYFKRYYWHCSSLIRESTLSKSYEFSEVPATT